MLQQVSKNCKYMTHEMNYSQQYYYNSMYFQILYIINNFHITCYTSNFALSVFFLGDFRRPVSSYTITARRENKCFNSKRQIILKWIEHHHSMYVVLLNAETRIFIFGFADVQKRRNYILFLFQIDQSNMVFFEQHRAYCTCNNSFTWYNWTWVSTLRAPFYPSSLS